MAAWSLAATLAPAPPFKLSLLPCPTALCTCLQVSAQLEAQRAQQAAVQRNPRPNGPPAGHHGGAQVRAGACCWCAALQGRLLDSVWLGVYDALADVSADVPHSLLHVCCGRDPLPARQPFSRSLGCVMLLTASLSLLPLVHYPGVGLFAMLHLGALPCPTRSSPAQLTHPACLRF